ncbi:hypothetical protein [Prescottella agglutinans]|jgi:hypothetical protein|uniref:Uncharacterized protein n=1 Tax=Prescottella agglutinans TaxID=1644129 RepID=A0ABT6MJK5_9NOCA|nr:hypothetical protein [Prescottella agglutinans]MDH6284498.1 hypothetical protein [Prescottella agglutinans]
MTTPPTPATVAQLFSDAELAHFVTVATERVRASGGIFALDESVRLLGERAWATYLRALMERAGLHEFAARIDPAQFGEYPTIRAIDELGRAKNSD